MDEQASVLDKGYVRLCDVMGTDLNVVNAARASFAKESKEFGAADARLINFLASHNHMSPFRHAFVTIEVKAPLMVARQWWKYVVGSDHTMDGWNEASRRYVTMEPEFYEPAAWRSAPEDRKQGSGADLDANAAAILSASFREVIRTSMRAYDEAIVLGAAVEQARILLPAYAMYTNWRWSASLESVAHLVRQRVADDAQWEFQQYALAVEGLVRPHFPVSFEALIPAKKVDDENPAV